MNLESHERAKKLLRAARVEGIAAGERQWLEAHLSACSECSREERALDLSIGLLRTHSVRSDPALVRRTSLAVQRRAEQWNRQRDNVWPIWAGAALASAGAVFTAPYVWAVFGWAGRLLELGSPIWQVAFVLWWFLPATVLGAIAGWRHLATHGPDSRWATETEWRQL
jgi:anti-sigma factor RsiW